MMMPSAVPDEVDALIGDLDMGSAESADTRNGTGKLQSPRDLPKFDAVDAELHCQDLTAHVMVMRQLLNDHCDVLTQLIRHKDSKNLKPCNESQNLRPGLPAAPLVKTGHEATDMMAIVPDGQQATDSNVDNLRILVPEAKSSATGRKTAALKEASNSSAKKPAQRHQPMVFADADALKAELRKRFVQKEYSVFDYYWETGYVQWIARHPNFETLATVCILLNSVWIGVDTEYNHADTLADAEPIFVVVENLFAFYFLVEWVIRFSAFKDKQNSLKDFWFVFDTCLVGFMIIETWILTLISAVSGSSFQMNLSVFRVLRLSRMARMARLLKSFPELAIMIKAVRMGLRSVFWTLVLLFVVIYVFAILFTQLLDGRNQPTGSLEYQSFGTLPKSIGTLLLVGALPDQADIVENLGAIDAAYYLLMLVYLFVATITLMNMLVATFCEVIQIISTVEREESKLTMMKDSLAHILTDMDFDQTGSMSKAEFQSLLSNSEYLTLLNTLGIDVPGLVDLTDVIFEDSKKELALDEFTDIIFNLRDENPATVRDVSEHTRMILTELKRQGSAMGAKSTLASACLHESSQEDCEAPVRAHRHSTGDTCS